MFSKKEWKDISFKDGVKGLLGIGLLVIGSQVLVDTVNAHDIDTKLFYDMHEKDVESVTDSNLFGSFVTVDSCNVCKSVERNNNDWSELEKESTVSVHSTENDIEVTSKF